MTRWPGVIRGVMRTLITELDILGQWDILGTPSEAVLGDRGNDHLGSKKLREKSCVFCKVHRVQEEIHHCISGPIMVQGIGSYLCVNLMTIGGWNINCGVRPMADWSWIRLGDRP